MATLWRTLPDEVLVVISRLLLGVELLHLSHVDRHLFRAFSRANIYAARLLHAPSRRELADAHDSKQRYALQRSLGFSGQSLEVNWSPHSYIPIVSRPIEELFGLNHVHSPMFTMDAWFSLSLATQSIKQGGVLFGLQNQECRNIGGRWSDFNCQILHVDGNRNLYCSVTDAKPCVAHQLETKRWYHVALVFEGQVQRIYLNGQLVDQQHNQNPQQLEWFPDWYAQVGTGFFYDGWYGFHGVVDHFRIWHEAMTADQIIVLGSDCATVLPRPEFSLKRDVSFAMAQGVEKVRCSRPRERWCEVVTAWKQTDEPECDVEQDVNRDVQAKTKCVPERGENTHQSNKCQGRRYKRKKKLGKRRALEREIKLGFNA